MSEILLEHFPSLVLDDRSALVSQRDFDRLLEYSHSLPTGVYPGKCWKRRKRWSTADRPLEFHERWLLGSFTEIPGDESRVNIEWRELLVVE